MGECGHKHGLSSVSRSAACFLCGLEQVACLFCASATQLGTALTWWAVVGFTKHHVERTWTVPGAEGMLPQPALFCPAPSCHHHPLVGRIPQFQQVPLSSVEGLMVWSGDKRAPP